MKVINPFTLIDVAILANGDFPHSSIPVSQLDVAKTLICCDGAANELISSGRVPNYIIGDGDSISIENKEQFANVFICSSEQETNDLTKAVTFLYKCGARNFAILGGVGKRADHTIGNISLLMDYYNLGMQPTMFTEEGAFYPMSGITEFETFPGQQISIFNLTNAQISAEGLKYNAYNFQKLWQGTLNEAVGEKIRMESSDPILMYFTYLPK